ncbi:helix-turn-helix domain-containing protein [Oscillibacter ruminantium]|uniref:helix-turn-helix domain-containing protein n=1 Tax=Oscillibacter ruminantium TaxID=1263547 RepID=UPI000687FAF0|nr:helix-turn-helix transcriptional regulator [Oscillibacter ruminantium]
MKTTDELTNEICKATDMVDYFEKNRAELQLNGFSESLGQWLKIKKCTKAAVARRSGLNRAYVYQIFLGLKTPSRDKVIALAFGFAMDLTETKKLLQQAGYRELYARDPRDALLISSVVHRQTILEANELLYDNHIECLE